MFLSFVPAWLACCILYGSSRHQKILVKPLPAKMSALIAALFVVLSIYLLVSVLPTVSAFIVAFTLICCLLPLITLISAYGQQYLTCSTALVIVGCGSFELIGAMV
ncbi:MAG: hypothetical protein HRU25_15535 [Psychrobium sp.]|nr:hypothetical protein [Psychrobium sp.]